MEEELEARSYQIELEEVAVKKNTIIFLPTGSGKTIIATSLITRFRKDLQLPWGEGGKRTFFLVNTVPLVTQQVKVIEKSCAVLSVAGYSSEDRVDYWKKTKWHEELAANQVIVMTTQILSDMLTHKYIELSDINLLIFDECHHAIDDHPMRVVMKHFEDYPVHKQPRVLGLTATLLKSNPKNKIEAILEELETTFHATIATSDNLEDVLLYSTNPFEIIIHYDACKPTEATTQAISIITNLTSLVRKVELPETFAVDQDLQLKRNQMDITSDPKKIIKAVNRMLNLIIESITTVGAFGGALGILAHIIILERLKRKALSKEEELLYKFTISHCIQARMVLLKAIEKDTGFDRVRKHSSPQVLQLLNVLKEYNTENTSPKGLLRVNKSGRPLCGIIFTRQRFTSKILYNLLKECVKFNPKEYGFLRHDFIVGFNVNPMKITREDALIKKSSCEAILKFKNRDLNCLISTSVMEEGIDIPQCSLVLLYDAPLEYRSYIQSKGRGRSKDASFVLFIKQSEAEKFQAVYNNYKATENYIQKILFGKTSDRAAPTTEDIEDKLYEADPISAFVTKNGNRLTSVSAISLLNRYCSVLPHDKFTIISPRWIKETQDDKNVISIIMPVVCPIKETILGDPMTNLKWAKRSAALKACARLYQEGELDENTLLPRLYGTVDFDTPEIESCFPNWPSGEDDDKEEGIPGVGTNKRMRKHPIVFPKVLNGPRPSDAKERKCFLHIIKLKTAFQPPQSSREKALYNMLQQDEGFGFLTPNALPRICDFPMFVTVGEVTTSLEVNFAVINLNTSLFELVKRFHLFVFAQVLEVAKRFLVFDGTVNNMYVVPIVKNGDYDIDWACMQRSTEIRPAIEPTFEERKSLRFVREDYEGAVVTPWYRSTAVTDRYIVSNVLEYLTPQSRFDDKVYKTYEDYYINKYNLEIIGPKDQFLLEVRNITTGMNCIWPRAPTLKTFTDKQKRLISMAAEGDDKKKTFEEIFIPEYCIRYDFPGVLWFKAYMLPCIVHRVTMLLQAHDLREQIAKDTGYGQPFLMKGEKWLPLELDEEVTKNSLKSLIEEPNSTRECFKSLVEDVPRPSPNIISMKESLYKLQKQKMNKEYPWDADSEPLDIERNLSTVTLMDIECYDEFVSAPLHQKHEKISMAKTTLPVIVPQNAAILPPPLKYKDVIEILNQKPSIRGPELRDVLAALITKKSNDTFDLERVETLGDSFLKFASTLYLFHKFPKLNEGQLTNIKCRLIGNRNLYYAGNNKHIGGRMKVEGVRPRKDFLVPGFFAPKQIEQFIARNKIRPSFLIGLKFSYSEMQSGVLSKESQDVLKQRFAEVDQAEKEPDWLVQNAMQCYVRSQAVSDKSVADCVEALIGTYLVDGGLLAATKICEWLNVIPAKDKFAQYLNKKVPTPLSLGQTTEDEIDFIMNHCRSDIESIIGYKFKDPSLLLEAMTHASYIRNRITNSYERMEFLGDAILDFLITSYIFENNRTLNPGMLTDLRSALVNNVTFAAYVVKLGLHKFMCCNLSPNLRNAIITFVEHQEQRDHDIIEDVLYLIDETESMAEYVDVPKVLSDIFESLCGAIFLDCAGDLNVVWKVFYKIMWREIDSFSVLIPKQPVKVLHEMVHACPQFGKAKQTPTVIPAVLVPVTVTKSGQKYTAFGFGKNKFQAKRAAAKLALKILSA